MVEELIALSLKASRAILDIYDKGPKIHTKSDGTPVTNADLRANEIIVNGLASLCPSIPIISEESPLVPFEERCRWKEFFLVDPLDGTREFIDGTEEFTVNIALVRQGIPVTGVICVPTEERVYFSTQGEGAYLREKAQTYRLPLEEAKKKGKVLRIVTGGSHLNKKTQRFVASLKEKGQAITLSRVGSSLKFCRIAEGKNDLYPRFGPTSEWDTASGEAILVETGGEIIRVDSGGGLTYNKEDISNPHFIARASGIAFPRLTSSGEVS